jgi:cobalamin biosynthetic protein CobC
VAGVNDYSILGGRVALALWRFAQAAEPWIDLSTGINPQAYPAGPADAAARARLPDPEETAALEAAAAAAFGVGAETVLATAGAEGATRLLAQALAARRVGIIQPTYGGHAAAWLAAGAEVEALDRDALDMVEGFDVTVVVNPNNPDGARISRERVVELAQRSTARGGWLIVDEAFVEVAPELSVISRLDAPKGIERLIVLRSFGKFYGLAGLRLGFVAAAPDVAGDLRRRQGEWPVGADAIAAGLQAYPDRSWAQTIRARLTADARRLDGLLERAGFEVVGGTSLFRLAVAADAPARFERLAQAGVLTRPFSDDRSRLRFGLPPDDAWARLEAALMETAG